MEQVGGHAWNAVEIDGKWYFTDITWDAKHPEEIPNCLKVSEEFMKSHKLNERSMNKLENCDFADADYDENNSLREMMKLCYDEFNLKSVIERVKSHQIEKKQIKTTDEMTTAELLRALFGEDFANELSDKAKSLSNDYADAVENSTDSSYRADTINEFTKDIKSDLHRINNPQIEENIDKEGQ